ncbi:MAG: hypothetical protein HY22_12660 [[Candidatus Thermochlorobacteriaceae] bacterium GBChlB]|nr:MAG: hypothetical protein HY22_12660 [[Candidatus Thermochlorobacteriaceae] bacterium GBChlB]
MMTARFQISLLWLALLLGLIAHSVLGMIPIVYNAPSPATESGGKTMMLLWQLSIVFASHLLLATLAALVDARWASVVNLAASSLFLLSNLAHPVAHLFASPIEWHQVFFLTMIAALNVQLVRTSFTLLKTTQ